MDSDEHQPGQTNAAKEARGFVDRAELSIARVPCSTADSAPLQSHLRAQSGGVQLCAGASLGRSIVQP